MTSDRLTRMMHDQLKLQELLDTNPLRMSEHERIAYIKDNVIALMSEVQEALQEIGWKPWATSRHINTDAAFGELRDAWQFLTNLMFAVTGDDPEALAERLETTLRTKHRINAHRHMTSYDGVAGKCPACMRGLDEITITELPGFPNAKRWRCICGATLDPDAVRKVLFED